MMLGLGFSINVLTMFAMVLAIGILVDDAIVVVENVERIMAVSYTHLDVYKRQVMFLVWGVAAMVVQLVVYAVVARAIRGLNEAIEENNIAMGGLIGSISLAAGVVNAACLT